MPVPVEKVCGGCRLKNTKPQTCPSHLIEIVSFVERVASLQNLGATFAYPATFTAEEWAALDGKAQAQNRHNTIESLQRRKDKATKGATGKSSLPEVLGRPMQRL